MNAGGSLPNGYRHVPLGDIDSTNSEAFRRLEAGDPGNLWLTANRQTSGRGRGERTWLSEPGNLYASLLLKRVVPLANALQIPFVAAVAVHDAIAETGDQPGIAERLVLKWPNDVMCDGRKVCGILIESKPVKDPGAPGELGIAVGIGVNVAHHPAGTRYPASNLSERGIGVAADDLFHNLACRFAEHLAVWNNGDGFQLIRDAWQARSMPRDGELSVQDGDTRISGKYAGLDADGALLLKVGQHVRRFTYGDVMHPAPDGAPPQ